MSGKGTGMSGGGIYMSIEREDMSGGGRKGGGRHDFSGRERDIKKGYK
jgi:hypothetical protein